MRVDAAAHYCGVSESAFLSRVKSGQYPPGEKDGGARVWLKDDLDEMIEQRFGVTAVSSPIDDDNPFSKRLGA
jgi:predicted DNA-binding transcriptional regulator AlpA|tara:strand:- start:613 stop:831 length:219 start_codon:yes stop_codon:yes gene_type:complete